MSTIIVNDVSITLAKSAGFCFGVDRAINVVNRLVSEEKKVCTLGPIIHNDEVVSELSQKGVVINEAVEDINKQYTVVIRSHGVPKTTYDLLNLQSLNFVDATCPFVTKIHKTVNKQSQLGKVILILGDENHPEVIGIKGHCVGPCYTAKTTEELKNIVQINPNLREKEVCLVAQTTFDVKYFKKCLETAKKLYTNLIFFDTICNATSERQTEAGKLAEV